MKNETEWSDQYKRILIIFFQLWLYQSKIYITRIILFHYNSLPVFQSVLYYKNLYLDVVKMHKCINT